jgi:hypothetical protein
VGVDDNGWRLAGLAFAHPVAEVTAQFLTSTKDLRSPDSIAPEEDAGESATSTALTKDMYAFGALATVVLGESNTSDRATEKFLASIVEGRLLSPVPSERPSIAAVLQDEYAFPRALCPPSLPSQCAQPTHAYVSPAD